MNNDQKTWIAAVVVIVAVGVALRIFQPEAWGAYWGFFVGGYGLSRAISLLLINNE